MTLSFTTAVANALLTSYGANLNTSGYLAIFDGAAPANCDAALVGGTNHVIAWDTFSATAFGTAAAHSISANTITGVNAVLTSTAAFFRTFTLGGSINATSATANNVYVINSAAGTTWTSYGAANNSAGTVFVCTSTPTGTGTCYPVTFVEQGACGTSGSDLNLNTLSLSSGAPVTISPYTRTL